MLDHLHKKGFQISIILVHLLIGFVASQSAILNGVIYFGIFLYFLVDVILSADNNSRAGFYALYLMGYEIVYRISGLSISAEFGKYACIIILLVGLLFGKRKYFPIIFFFLLLLLIPSIFLAESESITYTRKIVLFNISGPLSLIVSGLYFYRRKVDADTISKGMRVAFYPAIALLILLSLKSGIGSVSFRSVSSSSSMAGGYAPNQVSTSLGWFVLLGIIELIRGNRILINAKIDVIIITYLLIRGLLTMSRGGILGAFIAMFISLCYAILIDYNLREQIKKMLFPSFLVLIILIAGIWYINKLSNNYIYYRYMGKSTTEVLQGSTNEDKDYLTGRGIIMESDISAFKEYPILGLGYGMSYNWHVDDIGIEAAAHTEYTRLLSENGILGLIYMLIGFLLLPLRHFYRIKKRYNGQLHFIAFIIFSFATMFHAAMRLAIPGVLFGAAFLLVLYDKSKLNKKEISG